MSTKDTPANRTSQVVDQLLDDLIRHGGSWDTECICKKYQRMQTALETIAGMERMTFAECIDAETIMNAATEALAFDPLSNQST